MPENSTPFATADAGGLSVKRGDYVLATKFADGDPCDHFCVGFVTSVNEIDGRVFVANADGVSFRANGFRRAEVITPEEGAALVAAMPKFADKPGPSLWKRLKGMRAANADEKAAHLDPALDVAVAAIAPTTKDAAEEDVKTNRVILDITHDAMTPAISWDWRFIFNIAGLRERVKSFSVVAAENAATFSPACPIAGGTVNVNGQDMVTLSEFLRHTTKLTQEAGVAKRERDAAIREREELRKQIVGLEAERDGLRGDVKAAETDNERLLTRVAELVKANIWLSEDERNCLGEIATYLDTRAQGHWQKFGSMVRVILARTSPPEPRVWLTEQERDLLTSEGNHHARQVEPNIKSGAVQAAKYHADAVQMFDAILARSSVARWWLSAEEKGVLEQVAHEAETSLSKDRWKKVAIVTRVMLARNSPPEVEWIPIARIIDGVRYCRADNVEDALAKAGVKSKGVG